MKIKERLIISTKPNSYLLQTEGGGGVAGYYWIAKWCADLRAALAPYPRSSSNDASSSSSAVVCWTCTPHGNGRVACSLLRRSRHNYRTAPYSSCDGSCGFDAVLRPHPALPKRLQNVLEEKRLLSFKSSVNPHHVAAAVRTAMSDNFVYGDITR